MFSREANRPRASAPRAPTTQDTTIACGWNKELNLAWRKYGDKPIELSLPVKEKATGPVVA
eukprot:9710918-Lingulodinium_polyedra.AAC.1